MKNIMGSNKKDEEGKEELPYTYTVRLLYFFSLLSALLIIQACNSGPLTEDELNNFVLNEGNGLTKSLISEGYKVEVNYKPTDLLVAQELRGDNQVNQQHLFNLREKYSKYHYFLLNLSNGGEEVLQGLRGNEYSDLVNILSFRMNEFVNITTIQDTIQIADFIYQRTFGMAGATSLLFVFPRQEKNGDDWIQFNLKEFGLGLGNQNFRFSTSAINDVPNIKFNENISQ